MNRISLSRKIWTILAPGERRGSIVLLGLMFVGMVFETLGVGLVVPAVAILTDPQYAAKFPAALAFLGQEGAGNRGVIVMWAMVGLAGINVCKAAFLGYLAWEQTRFVFSVQANLSQRLFTMYLRQPYTFHLQHNSAQLIGNSITEVNMFTFHAMVAGMTLLAEVFVLVGLGALLLAIEPVGAIVVVGVLGAAAWGSIYLTRGSLLRWGESRQRHESLRIQHLQQGLGGVKDVKVLGREKDFLDQYSIHNEASAKAGQLQMALQQMPRLWLELLAVFGLALLVFTLLAQGRELNSILPTLGLFAAAAFRLMPSANRVLGSLQSLRFGLPVIDTLYRELSRETPPVARDKGGDSTFRHRLEFRRVSYCYTDTQGPALDDISLVINRGESVGIIGTSGAGKSTLVDVLLGLLTPGTGEVCVDGSDIQKSLRAWQDKIGYVPQSIFLTDDTLRKNVAFGLSASVIDDEAVWRALRAAQLEEFVRSLSLGLDTIVGERGVRLSGGQRQRIGIARALYHEPEVLVLDEATSSLDTATEAEVMNAVSRLRGDKTVVIIAHRLSTVEKCSRLYRLETGRVVETGTPESMLRSRVGT